MRYRFGIRRKLFCILLVILAAHAAILAFMGSRLFEGFYESNKLKELKSSARQIQKIYQASPGEPDALYDQINHVENRNGIMALLTLTADGEPQIEYFTRDRHWDGSPRDGRRADTQDGNDGTPQGETLRQTFIPPPPPELDESLLNALPTLGDDMLVSRDGGEIFGNSRLCLALRLDDNLFLYLETPKSYLRSTADLAVQYTSYLSAAILLAGAVGLYLLAGGVTRPIRSLQNVADKIARMDFSESCPIHSNDELGALSESINHMSGQLQQNIARLMEANAVLQSDLERQQKVDRMRRQFVANVSHDFKTPLTLMISYAEALESAVSPQQAAEYRATIMEEGNRLSQMVGSLLELSQLESGTVQIRPSIFCLEELLDSVVSAHKILAAQRELRTSCELEEDFIVEADFQKMTQVAANLYDNAVKYAPHGGEIRLSARRQGAGCIVSVYNTSPPIPPAEMENLFDSFYRADRARHRDGKSYGLGLAVVKAIVEMHGQSCGCENAEGGVRFWFTVALAELEDHDDN